MQEPLFADNWQQIIDKVSASSFCTGQNDRGWKVDLDWLLKNSGNYAKVLEGKYDGKPSASNSGKTKPKPFTPEEEQAFLAKNTYLPTEDEADQLLAGVA